MHCGTEVIRHLFACVRFSVRSTGRQKTRILTIDYVVPGMELIHALVRGISDRRGVDITRGRPCVHAIGHICMNSAVQTVAIVPAGFWGPSAVFVDATQP